MEKAKVFHYDEVFQSEDTESSVGKNFNKMRSGGALSELPPYPNSILVEISNICNHRCSFCAQPNMERRKNYIDTDVFKKIVTESYELGTREISLVGGSEPLANKRLEEYISFCRDTGYEYIYITSNSTLGDEARWKRIIDAGIDSVKISINGGDRETYKTVHGRDEFDKAIANVRFINEYRKTLGRELFLGVSFVETEESAGTFEKLREIIEPYVDEIVMIPQFFKDGEGRQIPPTITSYEGDHCYFPFAKTVFSREGYMRVCCQDYENDLAVGDIHEMHVGEAWASGIFKELRKRHINKDFDGLYCKTCLFGSKDPVFPLNPKLK